LTPESRVKEKVRAALRAAGAYWHMPVQNGMGAPSLDFVGCHEGRFFAVETKAGGKDMTPRQAETARRIEASGGRVFLVNEFSGMNMLTAWLIRSEACVTTSESGN
jgi:predicted RecB family endonuclease